ncbi:MAG TPA: hypothetical protein DC063_03315 [Arenimonas sp.]|nr:hypothetical protein [Arenimonas sp.]
MAAMADRISLGLIGARGYVGAELIKLVAAHPRFELAFVSSRERDGQRLAEYEPAFTGELRYSNLDTAAAAGQGADALVLALLRENGRKVPGQDERLLALSRSLQARGAEKYAWYSTQEQIALARLGRALALDGSRTFAGRLTVGTETTTLTPDRLAGRELGMGDLAAGVRFVPEAEAPVFATVDVAGIPRTPPAFDDSAISVKRSWFNPDGTPWKPGPLREGQVLVAALRIEAKESMPDALLVDRLPAGLEIENLNLTDPDQWADVSIEGIALSERSGAAELAHEEYRDDRYVAALKLYPGQAAQLFYLVRAVTPGTYVVPPPQVEDMYRPELRGVGRAVPATVTVSEP